MRYQVIVSDRVKEMLGLQLRFLAQVDKKAAARLRNRFMEKLRSLCQMPQRAPFLNEPFLPANKYHKLYVENWFLVIYQIRDNAVYVDWIVDCRQDYQWLLR